MTDSHGLAEAQLLDDVRDIRGIGRDLVGAVRLVAFAVTTQVEGHERYRWAKCSACGAKNERSQVQPHEDKGRLAGAAILNGQLDAAVHYRRHVTSPASLLQI